jgi:type I restriction enzyme S subunit
VSAVLGALDDKIDSNSRLARCLEEIAVTLFRARFVDFAATQQVEVAEQPLRELTLMIQRGRAPSYCEEGGTLVINQKCVRAGRIDFSQGRRHDSAARPIPEERMLRLGDVLVNSTGVGTLGRLAPVRWLPEPATVDGHVTIVRPDPDAIALSYLALELGTRQAEIEALAEGSTGQTELSRARLGEVIVRVPERQAQDELAQVCDPATARVAVCERETITLTSIRDALLPKLISGQIGVPDAADLDEALGSGRFGAAAT